MRLIDADKLIYALEKRIEKVDDESFVEGMLESIIEINSQPIVDAKPIIYGEWLGFPEALQFDALTDDEIACNVCGHSFSMLSNDTEEFDYCPHCGAKMGGG